MSLGGNNEIFKKMMSDINEGKKKDNFDVKAILPNLEEYRERAANADETTMKEIVSDFVKETSINLQKAVIAEHKDMYNLPDDWVDCWTVRKSAHDIMTLLVTMNKDDYYILEMKVEDKASMLIVLLTSPTNAKKLQEQFDALPDSKEKFL